MNESEVLIIGSGAAGLTCALKLAQMGIRSTVVSKTQLESGATLWAQGGISAVFDEDDSLEAHVRDTLIAGADLCDDQAVKFTVERGPGVVRWLNELGVAFTRDTGAGNPEGLHLTREGGHSHRRVVHAADATGHAVETTLAGVVLANPLITVRERLVTLDLILDAKRERVVGAYLYDRNSKRVEAVSAKCVVLATGARTRSICTRAIPTAPRATASRWPGERAVASPTWNSCSSTRRFSTTRVRARDRARF